MKSRRYRPSADARPCERGSVTVLTIAMVVLAGVMALGVARLGHAASDRARADTAADAGALAAAGALALGRGSPAATLAARETAASNDAVLVRCDCRGRAATVVVRVGAATGRARAEVRFECLADPERC
jgi:secretion/DNA translocation related TadE-like protein